MQSPSPFAHTILIRTKFRLFRNVRSRPVLSAARDRFGSVHRLTIPCRAPPTSDAALAHRSRSRPCPFRCCTASPLPSAALPLLCLLLHSTTPHSRGRSRRRGARPASLPA
eukprot:scaffold4652_cov122-Isochrysis_galbana.AAC.1